MIVSRAIRLDLLKPRPVQIHCMQHDNTQVATVALYRGTTPYDVAADTEETVVFKVAYILPNGYGDEYSTTELGEAAVEQNETTRNIYTVRVDGVVTDVPGFAELMVNFTTESGQCLTSFPMTVDVRRKDGQNVDPDGGSPATSRYLRKDLQTPATEGMTQPVGITPEGALVTAPGGGGEAAVTPASIVTATEQMNSTQKSSTRQNIGAAPSTNIAKSALASAVQTSLGKADGAVPKSAQANAENFSSALVIAPAGVDSIGAIKSPVAVYGTVTRSGSAGHYTYSANISAIVLYPLQQTYPHMRAFLVDHEGRECTLIKPPASDQDNLVFYTLDKANKKIVYYTVATSGATTVAEDAYNGGGEGGGTPTWEDILPEGGIPQTDLAKLTVTITKDGSTYSSSATSAAIYAAQQAGKKIEVVYNGFRGEVLEVGENACSFKVTDITNPNAPVLYVFVVAGSACSGASTPVGGYLPTSGLTAKTSAMTQAVGYRASDGTLWTTTGSGGGGGEGGLTAVYVLISRNGNTYDVTIDDQNVSAANILTAMDNESNFVRFVGPDGVECQVMGVSMNGNDPTIWLSSVVWGANSVPETVIYTIEDVTSGHGTATYVEAMPFDTANALIPQEEHSQKTASSGSASFSVAKNTIYTISGDITNSLAITNASNPGGMWELRFQTGSTAPNSVTWPSWVNWLGGFDGTLAANTYYKIIVDDAGNAAVGTRSVSA